MAVPAQLHILTIREITKRGLAHARAQGRVGGRSRVMNESFSSVFAEPGYISAIRRIESPGR